MRKLFLSHKKKIAIACGLLIGIFLVAVIALFVEKRPAPSAAPSPPGQQEIDTGLSLQPTTAVTSVEAVPPVTATPPATSSAPPSGYPGCQLSLDFILTEGALQSVGDVDYTLAAKNIGEATCQSASVSVYYAQDETYASSAPSATADGYYWQLGNLAPGKEVDISLVTDRTAPLAASAVTDEACLSADNGVDACSNSLAGVTPPSVSAPASTAPGQGATVSAIVAPLTAIPLAENEEAGVWVWTSPDQMTQAQMEQVVNEAAENKFNAIYITVDGYLNTANIAAFDSSVAEFLSLAAAKGIAVDAEAGSKDWAEPANTWKPADILAFVEEYNASHSIKFRGVQFDIEPYLLPQYDSDEGTVLTQYVSLVDQLVQIDKSDRTPLTIVVPLFYDENEGWTPQVTVDGVTDYTYRQIVRLLNELPPGDGRIIEMAYRNFATGADSAIALSAQEVEDADPSNVRVLIAQETGPVSPSYVTFYGTSRVALFGQIAAINQAFASDTAFGGIAVDYLDPFLELQ
ncbi:MAG TPA: hypothetical protein VMA75_00625 [Candidatus Paceibacterota bacterium]|nr:hypothetical protein [Candidatus Paceibacterota bacterium]